MIARIFVAILLLGLTQGTARQTRKVSVDSLLYDLKHPEAERRRQAAIWLGQNRVRKAVPALIAATSDPDERVRQEAGKALVALRDPAALEAFVALLDDSEKENRLLAIDGIVDLYVVEHNGFLDNMRKVADAVNPLDDDFNPKIVDTYIEVDPRAIQGIATRLRDGDSAVRKKAALALGILRGRQALPEIQAVLEVETHSGIRIELIRALYKIADPEAARSLIPLIRDDDKQVHDEAIYTLGRLQVVEASSYLKELYDAGIQERRKILRVVPVSSKDNLQRNLFRALSFIGDPECQDLFTVSLTDSRDFYRRYAAEGLARIADPSLTTGMGRAFLREKDQSTRLAMSFALYRMGRQEHLDDLVRNLSRDQVYSYLLSLDPGQIRQLYPYLEEGEASTIVRLLDIIGIKGDSEALSIAERYAQSDVSEVLSAANLAVRRLRARGVSE